MNWRWPVVASLCVLPCLAISPPPLPTGKPAKKRLPPATVTQGSGSISLLSKATIVLPPPSWTNTVYLSVTNWAGWTNIANDRINQQFVLSLRYGPNNISNREATQWWEFHYSPNLRDWNVLGRTNRPFWKDTTVNVKQRFYRFRMFYD